MKSRWENMEFTIDIGTTAVKIVVYQNGKSIWTYQENVDTVFEPTGVAYQDPKQIKEIIWHAMQACRLKGIEFKTIVLSTPMHTLIPLQQETLKMYIWSDQQASQCAKKIKATDFALTIYQHTGTPIHPMSPFCKLAFFKEAQSDMYRMTPFWSDLKAYLMEWLTGEWVTDYSNASASGLFNTETFRWDESALDYLELTSSQFPQVADTIHTFSLTEQLQGDYTEPITVMIGSSDGCLASLAGKVSTKSTVSVTLGTSGAIRVLTTKRTIDPLGRFFCYYLMPGYWVIGGPTNNGGKVLEWLAKIFCASKEEFYQQLPTLLKASVPGANRLVFYPYLFGERAPLWSGDVTAAYQGLKWEHEKADLVRAAVEGILFNLNFIKQLLIQEPQLISVSGGFFQQPELIRLSAAIFSTPICYSEDNEPTYGAYLLANSIFSTNTTEQVVYEPDPSLVSVYATAFSIFSAGLTKISEEI